LTDSGARQRLTAILAADAAGYSRLMAADEAATVAALDAARAMFRSHIESHQGRVIDMAGDSVLAVFETATGAVTAAMAIQHDLHAASLPLPTERRMLFRIGVHLGDVIEKADGTVYGDGVNIAARLQGLARPGGITVSDAVKVALRGRVSAIFEDRDEQTVKNIPEPVRAYAIRVEGESPAPAPAAASPRSRRRLFLAAGAGIAVAAVIGAVLWLAPWRSRPEGLSPGQTGLSLPAKPSIAVLPFDNMGGDPEQSYFADGITEDLITDLSKVGGLFVIARNSTFAYKSKARDVREIARALGVRYVLEGSVRRSGGDVRVNAQLIDATTGGHVWADRYDGDMKNIFGLQDKVTRSVVSALAVELTKEDSERVARRGTENAQAYDVFLKGWQHYLRQTPEEFRAAIADFKRAVELDPKYGRAYAALAATYWEAYARHWNEPLGLRRNHEAQFQTEQFLAKAMRDPTPLAHQVASAMALFGQQYAEAVAEARKAVASDPNDADGYVALAATLSFTGKPREALESVERGMRLNPQYPLHYLYQLGLAQFGLKRLDDTTASLEKALTLNREDYWSQRLLLSTYGLLGRREQAAKLLEDMRKAGERRGLSFVDPITIRAISYWYPYEERADAERFAEGLRKAGVAD
jgi:TolB-like protein/class 3 adenylate cyclase